MKTPHAYATLIPHSIDAMGLTPHAFRLYCAILRSESEHEGPCTLSTRQLARHCGMSTGRVSTARAELVQAGLLPATSAVAGYVYLMCMNADRQYYKIGKTINVEQRYANSMVKLPFPVVVLHVIPTDDYSQAETSLHRRYSHRHFNGEWYLLTEQDVAEIKAIERI